MFQETFRHNWRLFFHCVGVGANLFAGMWGEIEPQSNCTSHYSWSFNQQMGSLLPPSCFLLQDQRQVVLFFVFSFPCIQTSTLKNPTAPAKAKASGKDSWSRAGSSPESVMIMRTTLYLQGPIRTGPISARIHGRQLKTLPGSTVSRFVGPFPPDSYSLWLILPLVEASSEEGIEAE